MSRTLMVGLVLACAGLTTGCDLFFNRAPLPARELYRLRLADSLSVPIRATNASSQLLEGALSIAPYQTPGLYGERGVVFRVGESAYGAYPSREWAVPLGEMLGTITESVLQRAPITREQAVYDPPSRRSLQYIWRGTVREFEEVNRGKDVSVAVRLDVQLVRSQDDSLIWSGSARLDRPVPQPTMDNIVAALSDAAIDVIGRLSRQAVHDLVAQGTSGIGRPN